ncbi:MAG TPA: hypothetical protein DCY03_24685 [Planctomycetaceae bacterium]|nr:hypothetical protein [Planctomycetaceae bacterium]
MNYEIGDLLIYFAVFLQLSFLKGFNCHKRELLLISPPLKPSTTELDHAYIYRFAFLPVVW